MLQKDDSPTPAAPEAVASPLRPFIIVFVLAGLHAWLVWGYSGTFWRDHGRWLHGLERFAAGEVPYRDFFHPNPPLALWITASLAKIFGTSLAAISAQMVFWYFATLSLFLLALRRYTPQLVLPIAVPSLLFAFAYSCRTGVCVPMPIGSESPAGVIGFICVLGSALMLLENVERQSVIRAVAAGVLAGLAVLSKHDYWVAAAYLTAAVAAFLFVRRARPAMVAAAPLAFLGTIAAGTAVLLVKVGWAQVIHVFAGSGRVIEIAVKSTPSLERLTAEVAGSAALVLIAVAGLWLCLVISDRTASRWTGAMVLIFLTAAAIHLGMSVAIGRDLIAAGGLGAFPTLSQDSMWRNMSRGYSVFAAATALLDSRLQQHLFPMILSPILLAVMLGRWRRWQDPVLRWRVAMLLGLCIVARTRRGFTSPDWYNILLELPAYALFLTLLCGPASIKTARTVRAALSVLIVLGLYAYVSLGNGPFTFQGAYEPLTTRRGVVHWPPSNVAVFRAGDSLVQLADSTGNRPLFALGGTGGWNYFLARKNPLPYTDGLLAEGRARHDSATAMLHASPIPPLLLFNRYALRPVLGPANAFEWEPRAVPNLYAERDLRWFNEVTATCRDVGQNPDADVRVYDCDWKNR